MQVDLIALLQNGHLSGRNGVLKAGKGLIEKGLTSVAIGEVEENVPTDRLARQSTDALYLFRAGNCGTCGLQEGPLGFECGASAGHVIWTEESNCRSRDRASWRIASRSRKCANLDQIGILQAGPGVFLGEHVG